jgi:hypothetical protein
MGHYGALFRQYIFCQNWATNFTFWQRIDNKYTTKKTYKS